jgi:hypothetical protein
MGSFIPPELDFSAILPTENDAVGTHHDQFARNKAGMLEFALGNLPFASQCAQVSSPGHRAGGHVIISSNLNRFEFVPVLPDADNLVEMPWIMADPLTCKANCFYHSSDYLHPVVWQ